MNVKESNELIAGFMGAVMTPEDHTEGNEDICKKEGWESWIINTWSRPEGISENMYKRYGCGDYTMGKWHYHESWDWLMPVVEKIEALPQYIANVTIDSSGCVIDEMDGDFNFFSQDTSKISAVYNAVVTFIHYHNNQNQII